MHRLCDGVQEVSIRRTSREIDDYLCARRDRCGDLDIEHHLGVWALSVRGSITAAVYRHCGHVRRWNANLLEIRREICRAIATAEFDDPDDLAAAVHAGREVVEGPDLSWRVALERG